jgi:hypothetical protein
VAVAGYFVAGAVIRNRVDAALRALPPSLQVSYTSLQSHLFQGSMELRGVRLRFSRDEDVYDASIDHIGLEGIHFLQVLWTKRLEGVSLRIDGIAAQGGKLHLSTKGSLEMDSVSGTAAGDFGFGAVRVRLGQLRCRMPHAEEELELSGLELDSRKRLVRMDTLRVIPRLEKTSMGKARGHQTDVWDVTSEGIVAEGVDVPGLREQRFVAERITVRQNRIHVFRDRRLPLEPGEKALPVMALKALPPEVRVGVVKLGLTNFSYEEFPKEGGEPATLKIYRMTGTLEPLVNRPGRGDPAYLTLRTEGSLMNSGTVTATTKMPLHKGDPYLVEGAFHDLDVTRLNEPAEKLGKLHLESGMLNRLDFHFEMREERATGEVTGRYHALVVDKLKKNGKVDKFKSFALKHLIIPKNKEKAKGKVDYQRDPERYFSYYLLHCLLTGVKSSFSLGFLLPG